MILRIVLLFFVFGIIACEDPVDIVREPAEDLNNTELTGTDFNILFVGNSLTFANDLPYLVKKEAEKRNVTIGITTIAKGNYAIVDHWGEGEVQRKIESELYDYVVIQQGPSSTAEGRQMLIEGGKEYSELCKEYNAELCYYMVWPSLTFFHTFDDVIKNYSDAAELNDATLLPVGVAWKRFIDDNDSYEYYGDDGFHPSLTGSLKAADVIVSTLF